MSGFGHAPLHETWSLLVEAGQAWFDDHAASMGAALAYYTLFSIAPLLLIAISIAGLLFGEQAARGEVFEQLAGLIGPDGAATIEQALERLDQPRAGVIGTVVGVGVVLVGATTVFGELQAAMDRIWGVPKAPRPGSRRWWQLVRTRLLSFGMVLAIGFLLIVSLLVSAGISALATVWAPRFNGVASLVQTLDAATSFALLTLMFAAILKWLPRVKIAWRDVWFGAMTTAALFALGKSLIGLYIGRSAIASAFGAAAVLVVLQLWVYYSAQVFLFGAELTRAFAHRHGSLSASAGPIAATAVARAR
ncbi:YihY/virulence factor BrkB family protein [Caldimonas sp. KR1-144]|uniref:YihY/virulence factor BrkB family protein n=1 Tax=Caldimonas sp. KR1-144 TaxID=3400911 RepID=UPI003C122736